MAAESSTVTPASDSGLRGILNQHPKGLLALATVLWFFVVFSGSFGTGDTNLRLQMTHAWLFGGSEVQSDLPRPMSRENIDDGVIGQSGKRYVFYDPGQSILMMPGDWIGTKIHRFVHTPDAKGLRIWAIQILVFLPSTLALVLVAYWLMGLMGFPKELSALASFIWLICTTVLPYVQASFQNNQVLLFALLSMGLVLHYDKRPLATVLFLSGAAAGCALLIRTSAAIHVVCSALLLVSMAYVKRTPYSTVFKRLVIYGMGVLPFFLAGRIFDFERYGSVFTTGQTQWLSHINSDPVFSGLPPLASNFPFINDAWVGILGVLFSPAKSIFLYDPLLLPALIVAAVQWRKFSLTAKCFLLVTLVNLALHIALTSSLDFWHGDWAWAARYHVSSVEMILVALTPALVDRARTGPPPAKWILRLVVVVALGVQILAVALPPNLDITEELLEEPVMCQAEWDSRLEFRLGHQIRNLVCLESHSRSAGCPEPIAATAQRRHPECVGTIAELRKSDHLNFFPFDPEHPLFNRREDLWGWLLISTFAGMLTAGWLMSGLRTHRA